MAAFSVVVWLIGVHFIELALCSSVWKGHTETIEVGPFIDNTPSGKTVLSSIPLREGRSDMPRLGLGFLGMNDDARISKISQFALQTMGYRLIDLPVGKELPVIEGWKNSGVPREYVFFVYKLTASVYGIEATRNSVHDLLKRIGLKYLDLIMIQYLDTRGYYLETWKTLIDLKHRGLVKSIGLCNVNDNHIHYLYKHTGIRPAVVQLELHPFLSQQRLVEEFQSMGIVVQAYSPLAAGQKLQDPRILRLANKHKKTSAQILIRWCLQRNCSCVTKSRRINRVAENFDVYDFHLPDIDMSSLDSLDSYHVTNFDPTSIEYLVSVDKLLGFDVPGLTTDNNETNKKDQANNDNGLYGEELGYSTEHFASENKQDLNHRTQQPNISNGDSVEHSEGKSSDDKGKILPYKTTEKVVTIEEEPTTMYFHTDLKLDLIDSELEDISSEQQEISDPFRISLEDVPQTCKRLTEEFMRAKMKQLHEISDKKERYKNSST